MMRWKIGDTAEITMTIDEAAIERFEAVASFQRPEIDDNAVMSAIFGKRVAHGPISASLISAVLGMKLPGPGSILLEQSFRYLAPVYVDDTVTAWARVVSIRDDKPVITLETGAYNQDRFPVIEGTAKVLFRELEEWVSRRRDNV